MLLKVCTASVQDVSYFNVKSWQIADFFPKSIAGRSNSATVFFNYFPVKSIFDSRIRTEHINPFCSPVNALSESSVKESMNVIFLSVEELDAAAAGQAADVLS